MLEMDLIPNALREVGMTELKLRDGSKLTVEPSITASIPEFYWPQAEQWLIDHDKDGIIKNVVALAFDKGENEASIWFKELAQILVANEDFRGKVQALLDEHKQEIEDHIDDPLVAEVSAKKSVHPQTLKAFVREQMRQGVDVPDQLFGLYITNKAKIK